MVEARLLRFSWGSDEAWLHVGVTADAAVTEVRFAAAGKADRGDGPFAEVARQLAAYFAGDLTAFALDVAPGGTAFQCRVWGALRAIPHGQTTTYGEIAASLGQPTASRAVGLANGQNPVSIIVPCHRVIGKDGTLTGYAGGLENKRRLLVHEGALLF